MKKIKIVAGLIWAFTGLVLIIVLFPGLGGFSVALARLPFMKINPRYSGGETAFTTVMPSCTLVVHKPVFNGLTGDRKTGFVQVDWRGRLPYNIVDTIDFDRDNLPDFSVRIDTKDNRAEIVPMNNNVGSLEVSTATSYGWTIRAGLKKKVIL